MIEINFSCNLLSAITDGNTVKLFDLIITDYDILDLEVFSGSDPIDRSISDATDQAGP